MRSLQLALMLLICVVPGCQAGTPPEIGTAGTMDQMPSVPPDQPIQCDVAEELSTMKSVPVAAYPFVRIQDVPQYGSPSPERMIGDVVIEASPNPGCKTLRMGRLHVNFWSLAFVPGAWKAVILIPNQKPIIMTGTLARRQANGSYEITLDLSLVETAVITPRADPVQFMRITLQLDTSRDVPGAPGFSMEWDYVEFGVGWNGGIDYRLPLPVSYSIDSI